jgi:hypothetical protein
MKILSIKYLLLLGSIGIIAFSCVSNSPETTAPDNPVVGNWQGVISGIGISSINFDGAKVFITISGKDSMFALTALDTMKSRSPAIKDTILILGGTWGLASAKDSVLLHCSSCRVVDTSTNTLNVRNVDGEIIPIPITIGPLNGKTMWKLTFADLMPLVPLLGLDISGIDQNMLGILKKLYIYLEKISNPAQ